MASILAAPRRWLPPLLTAGMVVALATFLYQQRGYIATRYSLAPGVVLALAGLVLAALALRSTSNQLLFARFGVSAPWLAWFRLTAITAFSNTLPIGAGLLAKGYYLKRVHALPYGRFAVGQLTLLILFIATNGLVGLVALAIARPERGTLLVAAVLVAMLSSISLLFAPQGWRRRVGGRWLPWDEHPVAGAWRAWPGIFLMQAGALLASAASLKLCFDAGSIGVGLAACIVFSAVAILTRFVTLMPGGIGLRELLIGSVAYVTGFELRDAVVASVLARLVELGVVLLLGAVFSWGLSTEVLEAGAEAVETRDGPMA